MPSLTSCTCKIECQNHNYVQEESTAQYQVKEETQLFLGKVIQGQFELLHPNQVVMVSELINKSCGAIK